MMKIFTKYVLFFFVFIVVAQANIAPLKSSYDLRSSEYGARYYDPRTSVWQSPDPILNEYMDGETNGGVLNPKNLGLFTYTYNNPVNLSDPDGNSATGAVLTGFTTDLSIPDPTDAAPPKWAGWAAAFVGAVAADAVLWMAMSDDTVKDNIDTQAIATTTTESNENDGTVIYRWGSGTNTNLTPREKDMSGLSFSTQKPAKGKYTTTTMEAINATGSLKAIQDGPSHVSVMPSNPSKMQEWIESRPNAEVNPHPLTETLQSVAVKE